MFTVRRRMGATACIASTSFGTTVPGRPDVPNAEVEKQLRNTPPLPFPVAEDKLPVGELKVPKGFKVEVYASGIANARSMRMGDKGTLFVDLVDPASGKVLWRGWAEGSLDGVVDSLHQVLSDGFAQRARELLRRLVGDPVGQQRDTTVGME